MITNCIICGKSLAGLPRMANRKLCRSSECQKANGINYQANYSKLMKSSHAVVKSEMVGSYASRTQGRYRIPANQNNLCKRLAESFFCWLCHKEHRPFEVAELRVECSCGALFTLSLGEAIDLVSIVRVDRHR